MFCLYNKGLLSTESEEREVLGIESIPVAILPSCQYMKTMTLSLHKHEYGWIVKLRNTDGQPPEYCLLCVILMRSG